MTMLRIFPLLSLLLKKTQGFSPKQQQRHSLPLHNPALCSTNDVEELLPSTKLHLNFTSEPVHVYIEDTDAYGIIYNSNYLRMVDRALFEECFRDCSQAFKCLISGDNNDWSIVSVGHEKFVSSPTLGLDVVIQGQLVDHYFGSAAKSQWSVWNVEMVSPEGSQIYNVMTDLVVASSTDPVDISRIKDILPSGSIMKENGDKNEDSNKILRSETITIQRDELDAHAPGRLPLRTILNYFERQRTNLFGGPINLRKLQDEDGILAVVTSVRDLSLVWIDHGDGYSPIDVVAGDEIQVESAVQVKRKGMILEFHQSLVLPRTKQTIARGQVYLMMIDANTKRPTSKLPQWAKDLIQIQS